MGSSRVVVQCRCKDFINMTYGTGYCGAGHWAPQSAGLHQQRRTQIFICCLLMHHCTALHCRSISVYQSVKLLCGRSPVDDSSGTEERGTTWCSDNRLFLNVSETTEHTVHLRTNNLKSYGHNNPQQALLFRKGLVKGKLPPGGAFPKLPLMKCARSPQQQLHTVESERESALPKL